MFCQGFRKAVCLSCSVCCREAEDATVIVSRSKLMDAPGGREAMAAYEAAAAPHCSGQPRLCQAYTLILQLFS